MSLARLIAWVPAGRPKLIHYLREVVALRRLHRRTRELVGDRELVADVGVIQKLRQRRECRLRIRYSTEVIASRRNSSLAKVTLLTSYAFQSHARQLRSG